MKQARGDVRKLLQVLGEVQTLTGSAHALHYNDRDQNAFGEAQAMLDVAFNLCVAATSDYHPVPRLDEAARRELMQKLRGVQP